MQDSNAISVKIVWLSGKEERIGEFETVGQVKLHLLKSYPEAFLPDCVILAPDYQVLEIDAECLPVMHVIFQEIKARRNMQEWKEAITLHHKLEGFEGLKKIGSSIERDGFINVADTFERQKEFRVFLAVQTQDVNRLCDLVGYESHLNLLGIYTLVAAKGDPNADIGGSILLHAIYNRNLEAVNFLIERGVDVSLPGNHWCKDKLLPLNAAAELATTGPGDLSIVKALLKAGASVHQRGPKEKTVMEQFIESQRWMHQMPEARMTRLMRVHYLLEEARRSTPLPEGERDISITRFDLFPPKNKEVFLYHWEDDNTLVTSRVLDCEALECLAPEEGLDKKMPLLNPYYRCPSFEGLSRLYSLFYHYPYITATPTTTPGLSEREKQKSSRTGTRRSNDKDDRGRDTPYGTPRASRLLQLHMAKRDPSMRTFVFAKELETKTIHQRWKVLGYPEEVMEGDEAGGEAGGDTTPGGGSKRRRWERDGEDIIAIPYRGRVRISLDDEMVTLGLMRMRKKFGDPSTSSTSSELSSMGRKQQNEEENSIPVYGNPMNENVVRALLASLEDETFTSNGSSSVPAPQHDVSKSVPEKVHATTSAPHTMEEDDGPSMLSSSRESSMDTTMGGVLVQPLLG